MQKHTEPDLSSIHPPTSVMLEEAGRYLSVHDEILLVSLLHAVVQSNEDYRFSWPETSRGRFSMKFSSSKNPGDVEVISFKFAGKEPNPAAYRSDWFNLMTDDDDNFDIKIEIIPPEVKKPTDKGWHALCLARNLEHELAYATLCFLQRKRPHNIKLQRCIECEKSVIQSCSDYEYATKAIWMSHLEELEHCVNDAMHNGVYAPAKANWGIWRIPQEYRNYQAWFCSQENGE